MAIATSTEFTREEVGLARRNPGMPLEALRRAITPVGMHYVLTHFDAGRWDVSDVGKAAAEWERLQRSTSLLLDSIKTIDAPAKRARVEKVLKRLAKS